MITKKTPEELAVLQEAGALLARMLKEIAKEAVPGVSTLTLDDKAMELAEKNNVVPILLGYHPTFAAHDAYQACLARHNLILKWCCSLL